MLFPGLYFNPLYIVFALPALLLALYAQYKVKSTYREYSQVQNLQGMNGVDAARRLLQANGLGHVSIEGVPGELSDHYDPRKQVLRLSQGVAHSQSVAALGIVAHEVGHAVQDAKEYTPMKVRSGLVPVVNFGSYLGPIIFFAGLFLQNPSLAWLGVAAFSGAAVFALVTLPVELNASSRALSMLKSNGLVDNRQHDGAKKVLDAAALTYVAALAQALSTLLYYVMLASGLGRRD